MIDTINNSIFAFINPVVSGLNKFLINLLGEYASYGLITFAIVLGQLYKKRVDAGWIETIFVTIVVYGFLRYMGLGL